MIARVVGGHLALKLRGQRQRVAVDLDHFLHRHGIPGDFEIRGVRKQKTQGVADAAIAFDHALEDLGRDGQFA